MGNYCQYIVEMVCKTSCHTSHWLLPSEFLKFGAFGRLLAYFGLFQTLKQQNLARADLPNYDSNHNGLWQSI